MLVWALIDVARKDKFDLEGALYGAVCGLVMITPCAGYVEPGYSVVIGIYGTILCYVFLWAWMRFAHLRFVDDRCVEDGKALRAQGFARGAGHTAQVNGESIVFVVLS